MVRLLHNNIYSNSYHYNHHNNKLVHFFHVILLFLLLVAWCVTEGMCEFTAMFHQTPHIFIANSKEGIMTKTQNI